MAGAADALQLAHAWDREAKFLREFGLLRIAAEVTRQTKYCFLTLSDEPADGSRQRIELTR